MVFENKLKITDNELQGAHHGPISLVLPKLYIGCRKHGGFCSQNVGAYHATFLK